MVAIVVWYVPWLPDVPHATLDQGWRLALAVACERGFVFGVDLVFTFGPYGCFALWQYWPATYLPSLVFWGIVSFLIADLGLPRQTAGRTMLLALAASLWLGLTVDTALVALPLAHVVQASRERTATPTSWLSLVAMGPLSLVKFTVLPLCMAAAALGALARGGSVGRALVDLAVVTAAILLAWIARGQPLGAFGDYLRNSVELAGGYAEAMAWPTFRTPDAVLTIVAAVVVAVAVAAFVACLWSQRRSDEPWARRLAWPAFAFVALALAVRHATTRGDAEHLMLGFVFCGAFIMLASTVAPIHKRVVMVLACMCLVLMIHVANEVRSNLVGGSIIGRVAATAGGLLSIVRGVPPRHVLETELADVRVALAPMARLREHIDGTFDIMGHGQVLLLALTPSQWAPRPVLQSYLAYTPRLAALNAEHLRSARAPVWLVAAVNTIDGRWPLHDDARAWAEIALRYEPVEQLGPYLLLRRAERDRGPTPQVRTVDLKLEDWTDVPAPPGGSWYARFELPAACTGGLRALLWKPLACHLEVVMDAEGRLGRRFRLVRAIAADGFLLSPMIFDVRALTSWLLGHSGDAVPIRRLRVVDDYGHPVPVTLTLSSLPFPPLARR